VAPARSALIRQHLNALRHRLSDDRGSLSADAVLIWPVALMLFFAIIQGGLYYHGVNVASHAATAAADAAATEHGTTAAAQAAATNILTQTQVLHAPQIDVTAGSEDVTATVSGDITTLVPGWDLTVSQTASSIREHYQEPAP